MIKSSSIKKNVRPLAKEGKIISQYSLFVVPISLVAILLLGCATVKSNFEKAKTRDTSEAYLEFIEKFGAASGYEYLGEQAKQRLRELFYRSSIIRIEVTFINLRNMGVYRYYENSFKGLLVDQLTKKGYSVNPGDVINSNISRGGLDLYGTRYYRATEPYLKTIEKPDVDAIFIFIISEIGYRGESRDGLSSPYHFAPFERRATSDLTFLQISYHIFDLKAKERVFAAYTRGYRRSSYEQKHAFITPWREGDISLGLYRDRVRNV